MATTAPPLFSCLKVERTADGVACVHLNRPDKANAFDKVIWKEVATAFDWISDESDIKCAVLTGGESKHFCAGIDLSVLTELGAHALQDGCMGRTRYQLRGMIQKFQKYFQVIADCRVPVLAATHGACVGLGVDLIAAVDCRYCTKDALFSIKESQMAITADVGTLQRLPAASIMDGPLRELAYTGREFGAEEAMRIGLINQYFEDRSALEEGVMKIAEQIAANSPLAVQGTKISLEYARTHSVQDGLDQVATWNASMLISDDLAAVMGAKARGKKPVFQGMPSQHGFE